MAKVTSMFPDFNDFGCIFDDLQPIDNHQSLLSPDKPIQTKRAIHKCILESWIEGTPVPGFELPPNTLYARAIIRDARISPLTMEMHITFEISIIIGEEGCKFKGW